MASTVPQLEQGETSLAVPGVKGVFDGAGYSGGWIFNRLGALPDIAMRDGLLIDGKRNRLDRDEYLERLSFYAQKRYTVDREFFSGTPTVAPSYTLESTRKIDGGESILLKYPSRYRVQNSALRGEFDALPENRDGYLFHWRESASTPRPLVLCVHGFQMGTPARAKSLFKIEKMFRLGVDVALFMLPHHWRRSTHPGNPFRQNFLNPHNVPLTIESIGQTVHDLRSSVLLLQKLGYSKLAMIGASLGGLSASLYATVDDTPDCVFAVVPVINFGRTLVPRRWKLGFEIDDEIRKATAQALQIVTPTFYSPKVSPTNICVVYHTGDQLCESPYVRRWAESWKLENVTALPGGHWLAFDRKARGRAWYGWLHKHGYLK